LVFWYIFFGLLFFSKCLNLASAVGNGGAAGFDCPDCALSVGRAYPSLSMALGLGVDFVIFLDAVFDLNTQCGTGITFAVFCAAS
jgi:hypothetical protein